MVYKYNKSLIVKKPVAWTKKLNISYYRVCGYNNRVFNITQGFLNTILVADVLIILTGCFDESCEEKKRYLDYTCKYCKTNSFKEALKNVYRTYSNWSRSDYDKQGIKTLENNINKIEENLLKNNCLPSQAVVIDQRLIKMNIKQHRRSDITTPPLTISYVVLAIYIFPFVEVIA